MPRSLPKPILLLQSLEESFHREDAQINRAFRRDPVHFVDRSSSHEDIELFSFLIAGLSYGRVEQIEVSLNRIHHLLAPYGVRPGGSGFADFLRAFDMHREHIEQEFRGWSHRLNTRDDLLELFTRLSRVLAEQGSLAKLFQAGRGKNERETLEAFCMAICENGRPLDKRKGWTGTGLSWFASSPSSGSTCKRLLMWMRWMVRVGEPDLGVWRAGSPLLSLEHAPPTPGDLFFPIDTHVFRWARRNRLLKEKTPTWKSVETVTAYFKRAMPHDPLRYDFLIAHLGMTEFRNRSPAPEE